MALNTANVLSQIKNSNEQNETARRAEYLKFLDSCLAEDFDVEDLESTLYSYEVTLEQWKSDVEFLQQWEEAFLLTAGRELLQEQGSAARRAEVAYGKETARIVKEREKEQKRLKSIWQELHRKKYQKVDKAELFIERNAAKAASFGRDTGIERRISDLHHRRQSLIDGIQLHFDDGAGRLQREIEALRDRRDRRESWTSSDEHNLEHLESIVWKHNGDHEKLKADYQKKIAAIDAELQALEADRKRIEQVTKASN